MTRTKYQINKINSATIKKALEWHLKADEGHKIVARHWRATHRAGAVSDKAYKDILRAIIENELLKTAIETGQDNKDVENEIYLRGFYKGN